MLKIKLEEYWKGSEGVKYVTIDVLHGSSSSRMESQERKRESEMDVLNRRKQVRTKEDRVFKGSQGRRKEATSVKESERCWYWNEKVDAILMDDLA